MFGSTHSLLVACRCNFQCLCNGVHCVCLLFFAALCAYLSFFFFFFFFWRLQFAHLPYAGGCFLLYTGLYCTRWLCSAVCFLLTFVCRCWLLSVLCAFLGCFLVAWLNHCVGCQWYLFLASLPPYPCGFFLVALTIVVVAFCRKALCTSPSWFLVSLLACCIMSWAGYYSVLGRYLFYLAVSCLYCKYRYIHQYVCLAC